MATNNILDKARRMLALADRPGTPAEGETAQRMLRAYCERHRISLDAVRGHHTARTAPQVNRCRECGAEERSFTLAGHHHSNLINGVCADCHMRAVLQRARQQAEQAAAAQQAARAREQAEQAAAAQQAARLRAEQIREEQLRAAKRRRDEARAQQQQAAAQQTAARLRDLLSAKRREEQAAAGPTRGGEKVYYARNYNWERRPATPGTKRHQLFLLMSRPAGVTTSEACAALGWTRKGLHGCISELKRGQRAAGCAA